MHLDRLPAGKAVPDDIHVIIEVPARAPPIRYDVDQQTGVMEVKRMLATSMHTPCNFGYVPHTASAGGSRLEVLVLSPFALLVGTVIRCRPIGMLELDGDEGPDVRILAVPIDKLTTLYSAIRSCFDLPEILLDQIAHFFEHYKDLKPGRWVGSKGWRDCADARRFIVAAVAAGAPQIPAADPGR